MATKKKALASRSTRRKPARAAVPAPVFQRPEEVERWIRREVQEQERLYRRIVKEMDALNARRLRWVREFYGRIQTRGFSVHAGIRRKIRPEEIPPIPKKIRVVF